MTLTPVSLLDLSRSALSDRLRVVRRSAGLSQQTLATRLGVQRASVSQWECEARALPSLANLVRIAIETQVSFEWLATGRGSMLAGAEGECAAVTFGSFASTQNEEDLLQAYRSMSRKQREALLVVVQAITKRATDRS